MSVETAPAHVFAALEDGFRPPADPAAWTRLYSVVTGKACPECGTALGVLLGPEATIDEVAEQIQADHGGSLPDDWGEGHDHPVYLYCDNPICPWHGAVSWEDIRPVFETWIQGNAPTWGERLEGVGR